MLNLPWLLIPILSSFSLRLSAGQALHPDTENIWESFAPGEMLRLLERSTLTFSDGIHNTIAQRRSDATSSTNTLPASGDNIFISTPKSIQKRSDTSTANTFPAEDQLNAPTSNDEYNYDQAYEDFVRQYFNDKLAEDNKSTENSEDAFAADDNESEEQQSETEHSFSSAETEQLAEETKNRARKGKNEKCRRVRKRKQNCLICENARNGEKSESCTFSRASEPQSYAFEKERSYKKQRDTDEPSSQSVEKTSSEETEAAETDESVEKLNKRRFNIRRAVENTPKDSSTCIQMVRRGKICYQCVNGDGTTTKCYVPREGKIGHVNNKARPAKEKDRKVQKTQQRIYKRTISYSFEKGTNETATNETPVDSGQLENSTASSAPHLKEKIFIKVIKQNETISE